MNDIRTLALDAALRLDQARRGRPLDATPALSLAARYECVAVRLSPRLREAHVAALMGIGGLAGGPAGLGLALVGIARDLRGAAAGHPERTARALDYCLALHAALDGRTAPGPAYPIAA